MTIKLTFLAGKEMMNFKVENRYIFYTDRVWKSWVRCIPKDEEFIKKILNSRNKIPSQLIQMFNLSEKDRLEYENAKTETELAAVIIKDCKEKGIKLMKTET